MTKSALGFVGVVTLALACDLAGAQTAAPPAAPPKTAAPPAPAAIASTQPASAPAMSAAQLIEIADEMQAEAERLRGWKFKHPVKKDVNDEAQLRKFIEKRIFEEEYGGGLLQKKEAMLRAVALIPATCDLRKTFLDVLLNQVGGFYDPETKAFYMLNRGGVDYGPLITRILVIHELTHALDDQYFDLDKLIKSQPLTEDWSFTVGAVVEGSATALMTRFAADAMGSGEYDAAALQGVLEKEMARSEAFFKAPPYFSTLMANYLVGMLFVMKGELMLLADENSERQVGANMKAIVARMPESGEQILHADKYWDAATRDAPVRVDDAAIEALLKQAWPDAQVTHQDTLGELLCALLTSEADRRLDVNAAFLPDYWTNDAATGWGGDRFYLWPDRPGAPREGNLPNDGREPRGARGVWVTLWDSEEDRDEFVRGYERHRKLANRATLKVGTHAAVFLFNVEDEARAVLERSLTPATLKATRDGKPWKAE